MVDPFDRLPSEQPVLTPSGAVAQEVYFLNDPEAQDGVQSTVFFGGNLQGDVAIESSEYFRRTEIVNARMLGTLWLSMGKGEPPVELKLLDLSATWDPKRGIAAFQRRTYDPEQNEMVVQSTPVSSSLILYHRRRYTADRAHTYDLIDVPGGFVRVGAYRADDPHGYSYIPRHVFGDDPAQLELSMISDSALQVTAVGQHDVFVERAVRTLDDDTILM